MGNFGSAFFNWINNLGTRDARLLMVGLDAAGKTTILYKLKLGEVVNTIPTIGFNVESVQYKKLKFTVWDIGGQDKLRPLWGYYYDGVHGVVFVVDSNDRERISEAADELDKLLRDDRLRNASLLVLANKMDLPNAMQPATLAKELRLGELGQRKWYIQSCSALSGDGLYEGLDQLSSAITSN